MIRRPAALLVGDKLIRATEEHRRRDAAPGRAPAGLHRCHGYGASRVPPQMIENLGREGCARLLVQPPVFVKNDRAVIVNDEVRVVVDPAEVPDLDT